MSATPSTTKMAPHQKRIQTLTRLGGLAPANSLRARLVPAASTNSDAPASVTKPPSIKCRRPSTSRWIGMDESAGRPPAKRDTGVSTLTRPERGQQFPARGVVESCQVHSAVALVAQDLNQRRAPLF